MDHAHRELRIECLPRAIPDELTLDVSELAIGDSLHVRDIAIHQGVELRDDLDISVVIVAAPRKEEEVVAEAVEGEEAAVEGAARCGGRREAGRGRGVQGRRRLGSAGRRPGWLPPAMSSLAGARTTFACGSLRAPLQRTG